MDVEHGKAALFSEEEFSTILVMADADGRTGARRIRFDFEGFWTIIEQQVKYFVIFWFSGMCTEYY